MFLFQYCLNYHNKYCLHISYYNGKKYSNIKTIQIQISLREMIIKLFLFFIFCNVELI